MNLTPPAPFTLPTAKSAPLRKSPQMLVIYGPPKVGKTTALASLDDCLTLDLEDGSDFLEILKVKINSYPELLTCASAIRTGGKPYKYVAIDTVSRLEDWAEAQATANYKRSPVGKNFTGGSVLELANGGGYMWLRNSFHEMLMLCRSLANSVIFVAHLRDKMLAGETAKTGVNVSAKDLDLTGKCKQIICSQADAIGYLYRKPVAPNDPRTNLCISFCSSEAINCGSRCDHLKGLDMELDWKKIYVD